MAAFVSNFYEAPVDFKAVAERSMGIVLASKVRMADFEAEVARREQNIFRQGGLPFLTVVLAGRKSAMA